MPSIKALLASCKADMEEGEDADLASLMRKATASLYSKLGAEDQGEFWEERNIALGVASKRKSAQAAAEEQAHREKKAAKKKAAAAAQQQQAPPAKKKSLPATPAPVAGPVILPESINPMTLTRKEVAQWKRKHQQQQQQQQQQQKKGAQGGSKGGGGALFGGGGGSGGGWESDDE